MAKETDFTEYADKAPTPLQKDFAEWIPEATGYDPAAAKTKQAAFEAGVRLAVALRIPYQASDHNKERTAAARAEREEAAAAAKKAAKKTKAKAVEVEEEAEAEEVEAPRPAKAAPRKAVKRAATGKPAPF